MNRGLLTVDGIEAIDLSGVSPFFRRPVLQASVLALPVGLPRVNLENAGVPGVPQTFPVPHGGLSVQDMGALSTCQRFELPESPKLADSIADLSSLFPDPIDLGHSYMTQIALLSLISHYPERFGSYSLHTSDDEKQRLWEFESTVLAARVVLDRECFRLVPHITRTELMRKPLGDAEHTIRYQLEHAKAAAALVSSPENLRHRARMRRHIARELSLRWGITGTLPSLLSEPGPFDVRIDYVSDGLVIYVVPDDTEDRNTHWIVQEIDRRQRLWEGVMRRCSKVPAFAVVEREAYASFQAVFPTDPAYEDEIRCAVSSQRALLGSADVLFPSAPEGRREMP
jgi:hypothetical protein